MGKDLIFQTNELLAQMTERDDNRNAYFQRLTDYTTVVALVRNLIKVSESLFKLIDQKDTFLASVPLTEEGLHFVAGAEQELVDVVQGMLFMIKETLLQMDLDLHISSGIKFEDVGALDISTNPNKPCVFSLDEADNTIVTTITLTDLRLLHNSYVLALSSVVPDFIESDMRFFQVKQHEGTTTEDYAENLSNFVTVLVGEILANDEAFNAMVEIPVIARPHLLNDGIMNK